MRAALIPADAAQPCSIVDVVDGDFRSLAAAIGSEWIERVRTPLYGLVMVVDEEGLLNDKPVNDRLSGHFYPGLICGDALLVSEQHGPEGVDFVALDAEHERFVRVALDGWADQ